MKTTQQLIAAVIALLLLTGCAGGYSLREQMIRTKIPQEFRGHTNGIVAIPTDADTQAAIALGTASKDNDTLEYAYLTKAPRGAFSSDQIYVKVTTPLYLIANHSREQTREFRKVDDAFVQYARGLRAVRISMTQQFTTTVPWDAVAFRRQVSLLRDGLRVESLAEIQAWAGQSPFTERPSKQMQAAMAQVNQTAAQFSRGFAASMTHEQREQVLRSYRAMGLSEDQMVTYTGFTRDEIRQILSSQASASTGKVSLSEFDAVFPIDELVKPGRYEIVFRTPQISGLFARGDKEMRFPISFSGFR